VALTCGNAKSAIGADWGFLRILGTRWGLARARTAPVGVGAAGLFGQPENEVGAPVADVASDLEAARPAAEVAPVAQRPFGDMDGIAFRSTGRGVFRGTSDMPDGSLDLVLSDVAAMCRQPG
jgi:hypothetical protein